MEYRVHIVFPYEIWTAVNIDMSMMVRTMMIQSSIQSYMHIQYTQHKAYTVHRCVRVYECIYIQRAGSFNWSKFISYVLKRQYPAQYMYAYKYIYIFTNFSLSVMAHTQ